MANTVQEKASTNGHLVAPTTGELLPLSLAVEVNGRTIHAPGVLTEKKNSYKYVAARDAKLATPEARAALDALVIKYDGVVLEGTPVEVTVKRAATATKRAVKGGDLTRFYNLSGIILGAVDGVGGIAYQLQVRATTKMRNGTTPVVNFRIDFFRMGGGVAVEVGTIDGDDDFAV